MNRTKMMRGVGWSALGILALVVAAEATAAWVVASVIRTMEFEE